MQETTQPPITVTHQDLDRLHRLLDQHTTAQTELLDEELGRAHVVCPRDVPPTVITMNSLVVYEDSATGKRRKVHLVYPGDRRSGEAQVSVLAPIGCALLGLSAGQEIRWQVPGGWKQIRVIAVEYQPESAGDFHL